MGDMADWVVEHGWDDYLDDCYDDTFNDGWRPTPKPPHTLLVQEFKYQTNRAWLIVTMAGNEHWIPKSQISGILKDRIYITDWIKVERKMDIGAENTPPIPAELEPCDPFMDDFPWPTGPEDYGANPEQDT